MAKKYLQLKLVSLKAFTLLECLIALVLISGVLLVYQGLSHAVFSNIAYLKPSDQDRWLLFSHQLRAEFMGAQLEKVKHNKIYLLKNGKEIAFGLSKKKDFRKSSAKGYGYNPMLLDLADASISAQEEKVTIKISWKSGLVRYFIYDFK
ncbi:competence type IV pilus minor pilin ComGF [Streptococcus didelphis]|uniref:Competence type IV pilus minor pilin ComGF n=1 Tax=Streptococcus didelphis TaxID=102886 RepID=A0ABY9LIQ7_9STRE|nr:competence type IV pilus minor pilin ComGF [Streptococcus didelphis]WMB28771.1 competence type IV pilus minor pilin ComGF [Streptococcus didelphis]WMB29436.1 competence type IV pilus minor pilin ComGF [Streptococcus didelphis]